MLSSESCRLALGPISSLLGESELSSTLSQPADEPSAAASTPGTGKTTHAAQLLEALQGKPTTASAAWQHVNVGDFVKEKGCHQGWNDEWQSWDVDEDKVRFCSPALLPLVLV